MAWIKIANYGKSSIPDPDPTTFSYNGSVQSYIVPKTGTYLLEVWGAQGGSGSVAGGKGGYSKGNILLSKDQVLYVCVGGAGSRGGDGSGATGGYNGGGARYASSDPCGSGGGCTHIAKGTNRGTLSNYSSYRTEVLIVAGGGGGSQVDITGGTGGGTTGGKNSYGSGSGGTQTSGYAFGVGQPDYGGGAGGGWYGGYNLGGGSGYIGGVTNGTTSNGQRSGNGQAKISWVSA